MQKIKQPFQTWLATFAVLGLSATFVQASTTVSGYVSGTWTQDGSPYIVVGDVVVTSLIIQSNVTVEFDGPYVFEVQGILQAAGTESNPIAFYNTAVNAGKGWNGMYFNESSSSSFMNYCQIYGSTNSGIRIKNTSPAIRKCVVAGNSSPITGGGIYASLASGELILDRCVITNNTTSLEGGGVKIVGSCQLLGCLIADNQCTGGGSTGGGLCVFSGALQASVATLRNCTFANNHSVYVGGGLTISSAGSSLTTTLSMENCLVTGNTLSLGAGAGLFAEGYVTANVVNCTFVSQSSEAIWMWYQWTTQCNMTNSIVWNNNGGGAQVAGSVSSAYCDIQGGVQPGPGNISQNPVLDVTSFGLLPGSPCIDTGNPAPTYNDVFFPPSRGGARNDMGAFGGLGASGWLAGDAPIIAAEPKPLVSCLGQSPSFTTTAVGSVPLSYQWYFNGAALSGQTDSSLTLTNVQKNQEGSYFVVVSNVFGNITSTTNRLTVNDACVDIHMYAGLTVAGQIGSKYVLSYTTDLSNPNAWIPLATNAMGSSDWFYLDLDSPFSPHRFYKAVLQP
jgi:Immunoglobulin domain/Right handed beta helix region